MHLAFAVLVFELGRKERHEFARVGFGDFADDDAEFLRPAEPLHESAGVARHVIKDRGDACGVRGACVGRGRNLGERKRGVTAKDGEGLHSNEMG
ncbi:hypothetical protein HYS28_02840 [Candidatus Uhrbacteria bacterium]|nr:hypothetical protein [Candidatus Uhrbacteria bacterium]